MPTREYGQDGMWHTAVHFNGMFRQGYIFIADNDQGRSLYGTDGLIGYVGKMLHPAHALVEHNMERILAVMNGQELLLVCFRHVCETWIVKTLPEFRHHPGP